MLSTLNLAAATLSKPNTRNMLNFWKVGWPQNKPLSNLNCQGHPLLELRTILTCNRYGSKNKWAHSRFFLRWYINKYFVPTLEVMQKWLLFTTTKISICWSLVVHYQTWLTFAYTNLPMQKFIPTQREIKTYWKKIEKTLLVVHLSLLHAKQLLMKLLSESPQSYANLLLGLMPANYITTRCANPCPLVFIRVGTSIQKPVDSHLDKTRPIALKIWSCLIFNVQDLIVKLRASTLPADRRKLNPFSVNGFCSHCNTVFEAMGCFYHFCTCQELCPSLTEEEIKRGSRKRELDELRRGFLEEKVFTVIEMWECEWWRLYKTTINVKLSIRENLPYRRSLTEQQLLEGINKGKAIWLRSMRPWSTRIIESKVF